MLVARSGLRQSRTGSPARLQPQPLAILRARTRCTRAPGPPPGARSNWGDVLRDVRLIVCGAYTLAGVAHAADLAGPSLALQINGAPPFAQLGALGKAGALGWCVTGPLCAAAAARTGSEALRQPRPCPADAALAVYGVYELGGSVLCASLFGGQGVPVATGIQLAVGISLAWAYNNAAAADEAA